MRRPPATIVALMLSAMGCGAPAEPAKPPEGADPTTVTVQQPTAGEQQTSQVAAPESIATAPTPPPTDPGKRPPSGGMDRDGDGIADADDRCPDEPEDRDGFEDSDGCPEPDNDKDGILDTQDKCPNEPETKNGFQDEDGCPDKKK